MRFIILSLLFISTAQANVNYNPSNGTYTVDKFGTAIKPRNVPKRLPVDRFESKKISSFSLEF